MKKLTATLFVFFVINAIGYCQQKKFIEIKKAMEEKYSQNGEAEEDDEDNGYAKYKRWEWWAERHLDQQGYVINDVLKSYEVYEHNKSEASLTNNNRLSVGGTWTELSHTPFGTAVDQMGKGRIDCIVEVPGTNNVLAGTSGGGIWLGGRPAPFLPFIWTPLSDGISRLSITDICINPNNINEIYIATGSGDDNSITNGTGFTSNATQSRSLGILKSIDGGLNWNRTSVSFENSDQRVIYRMIMDPVDPQIMYAAASNGLFRTTNGWNTNQIIATGSFTDVRLKPDDRNILFLSGYDASSVNRNIFRVNNDGTNFSNIFSFPSSVDRVVIGVTPANGSYLYVLGGKSNTGFTGLYKCTNSGAASPTFNLQSSSPDILNYNATGSGLPNKQVFYDIVIAVHPQNAERVFAGGLNLWESTNAGVDWTVRSDWTSGYSDDDHCHSDFHQLKINSQGNLYNCNDGGLFTLNLSNNVWTYNSSSVNNTEYYRISIINQTAGLYTGRLILGGVQDNGTMTWRTNGLMKVNPGDGMDNAMASIDGTQQVASSQNGDIVVSANGGLSFTHNFVTPAENGSGAWVTPIVQHCTLPEYIYIGYKNIYFDESNGFGNWSDVINTNFPNPIIAMCQGNYTGQPGTNIVYCAVDLNTNSNLPSNYHLFRIENNLLSTKTDLWQFSNIITSVKCDPYNGRNVYVTLGGFGDDHKVYFSSDRGQSWVNISGAAGTNGSLPDLPVNCIALKNGGAGGIYVGTDIGVYHRANTNAGEKWTLFSNGLPNVAVTDLEIDETTNEIFAGTFGRGLWKSDLYESCQPTLNITGNTTGITYYEASNVIGTTTVTSGGYGNKITLNAGQEIIMSPGFSVDQGSAMWAYIQGCNDPRNDTAFDKAAKQNNHTVGNEIKKNVPVKTTKSKKALLKKKRKKIS